MSAYIIAVVSLFWSFDFIWVAILKICCSALCFLLNLYRLFSISSINLVCITFSSTLDLCNNSLIGRWLFDHFLSNFKNIAYSYFSFEKHDVLRQTFIIFSSLMFIVWGTNFRALFGILSIPMPFLLFRVCKILFFSWYLDDVNGTTFSIKLRHSFSFFNVMMVQKN